MPGKIVSTAQQDYLAIHKPAVLHELSGGHIAKGLPKHVRGGKSKPKRGILSQHFGGMK